MKTEPSQTADLKYSQFSLCILFSTVIVCFVYHFWLCTEKKTGSSSTKKEDLLVAGQLHHPKAAFLVWDYHYSALFFIPQHQLKTCLLH